MSEQNESGYWAYGEPPITHRPLEAALSDAEHITAETLRKTIDDTAARIAAKANGHDDRQGGFIQESGMVMVGGDSGPEIIHMPRNANVRPQGPAQFVILSSEAAREFIRKEVHKALYGNGEGIVDTRQHRRIRLIEDGGDEWHGTLYRVKKEDKG